MRTAIVALLFLFTSAFLANVFAEPSPAAPAGVLVQSTALAQIEPPTAITKAAPTVADPIDAPAEFIGDVRTQWQRGAYLTVTLLLLFGALAVARRYVKWLQVGTRAAIVATVATMLTAAITALASGATPSLALFVNAAAAGVALLINTGSKPAVQPK